MRKFSLLLGALGGGLAGYLFSNKTLREELAKSKDAEQAARTLGKHLQLDGQKLGQQVREFIESEDVQKHVKAAREFAKETVTQAKKEMQSMAKVGVKRMKTGTRRVRTKTRKLS